MGINGLTPFLKKASRRTDLSEFAGKIVAIDGYWWLHNGGLSCAEKLTLGEPTDIYVNDCMEKVKMLLSYRIKPIFVFDGRHVPAKAQVEAERREKRRANREKAIELLKMGKDKEARSLMKRAFDVTHQMALDVIKKCQKINVDCIVAPYEADSQLAYLNINGLADVIFTEDSDLMLFGCKKVFCKMNNRGAGLLIEHEQLYQIMLTSPAEFNMDDFIYMGILAGCDYLPPLSDIRLGKARRFIVGNRNCDIYNALPRLASYSKKSLVVPQEYRDTFILAVIAYKYPVVYCPLRRRQVRLNPPPPSVTSEQLKHVGEETDPETAFQLALGNYDPCTLEKLNDFDPDIAEYQDIEWYERPSIWFNNRKLTSNSEDSPPKENSDLKRSDIADNPTSPLKKVKQEDNFECEKLNPQKIQNVYESGGSTSVKNEEKSDKLTSNSEDSPPKENSDLKRSDVADNPTSPLKKVKQEDNFECEKLNPQEIQNVYESGGSTSVKNEEKSDIKEISLKTEIEDRDRKNVYEKAKDGTSREQVDLEKKQ